MEADLNLVNEIIQMTTSKPSSASELEDSSDEEDDDDEEDEGGGRIRAKRRRRAKRNQDNQNLKFKDKMRLSTKTYHGSVRRSKWKITSEGLSRRSSGSFGNIAGQKSVEFADDRKSSKRGKDRFLGIVPKKISLRIRKSMSSSSFR